MSQSNLQASVSRLGQWLASPLNPRQYLELINPLWANACCGEVVSIRRETDSAVTLEIKPNHLWSGAVSGQYVRLGIDVEGVRYWRCYSVASAQLPTDRTFSITIGRVDGGRVSTHIQDSLRIGDVIALDQATGDFTLPTNVSAKPLLFISAGTGVTPIAGMLRHLRDTGVEADVVHLHYAPDESRCLFPNELAAFNQLPGFRTHQLYTRAEKSAPHFSLKQLTAICPDWAERQAYVCGPAALMDAVRQVWSDSDLSEQLTEECFQPVRADVPAGAGGKVSFWTAGSETTGAGDKPLLEVAEDAGLLPAHGCRMGICQGCIVTLKEGQVRDLSTGEVFGEAGESIRICVCAAAGDVTIDL